MENQLLVRKIENGTVIDHVPAWHSEMVLRLLDVEKIRVMADFSMVSLNNVPSRKHGRKDVIKLNNYHLDEGNADLVCLVYPAVTINYIEDWEPRKYRPKIPELVVGRIRCPEGGQLHNQLPTGAYRDPFQGPAGVQGLAVRVLRLSARLREDARIRQGQVEPMSKKISNLKHRRMLGELSLILNL